MQQMMLDTQKFDEVLEFVDNPEPRCPCIFLIDTSDSMKGLSINTLNEGLKIFKNELIKHPIASRRIEVSIIAFNSSLRVVQNFVTVDKFVSPMLSAQGLPCMSAGIYKALDILQDRKIRYRANGIPCYRPWIFMITNSKLQGESNNVIEQVAQRIKEDEANHRLAFFTVGGKNANIERLAELAVRTPIKLEGLNFRELFLGLSVTLSYQVTFKCNPIFSEMLQLAA